MIAERQGSSPRSRHPLQEIGLSLELRPRSRPPLSGLDGPGLPPTALDLELDVRGVCSVTLEEYMRWGDYDGPPAAPLRLGAAQEDEAAGSSERLELSEDSSRSWASRSLGREERISFARSVSMEAREARASGVEALSRSGSSNSCDDSMRQDEGVR